MKFCLAAVMAVALCAAAAQPVLAQVLPSSGPASAVPAGPDDTPLARRAGPADARREAKGLLAGMPGPYLPNPSDPGHRIH